MSDIRIGSAVTLLDAVQLDDNPTSSTSSSVDVAGYTRFALSILTDSTLAPTDVLYTVQFSDDDEATWSNYTEGAFGNLRYEDTATASGLQETFTGNIAGKLMRVVATATGTDATNYFTVTVKLIPIS